MRISLHPQFKKFYKNRVATDKKLIKQTEARIALFRGDPKNPLLKDHGLTGAKKELRAFSITGDIRIVYLPVSEDEVIFLNIGSHNQVY